jgi:hypothetical protein
MNADGCSPDRAFALIPTGGMIDSQSSRLPPAVILGLDPRICRPRARINVHRQVRCGTRCSGQALTLPHNSLWTRKIP